MDYRTENRTVLAQRTTIAPSAQTNRFCAQSKAKSIVVAILGSASLTKINPIAFSRLLLLASNSLGNHWAPGFVCQWSTVWRCSRCLNSHWKMMNHRCFRPPPLLLTSPLLWLLFLQLCLLYWLCFWWCIHRTMKRTCRPHRKNPLATGSQKRN